jgi:hypothetical protein
MLAAAAAAPPCSDLVLKQSVAETASQFQQLLGNTSATGGGNSTEAGSGNRSVGADALREFVNRTMDNAGRCVPVTGNEGRGAGDGE